MSEDIENKEVEVEQAVETQAEQEEVSEAPAGDPGLSAGDGPEFKWYIVKAMTGQEGKVQKTLRERVINHNLSEFFSRIYVPEETVVTNANGKKRTLKKKLFPGYVLVKMIMNDTTWHLIKGTDKITGFVGGTNDKPAPITDEEAAYMTQQNQEGFKKPRSNVNFSEGETVKVVEGPFASFVGTIEAVSDKGKVKVSVSIFGRPTPVELDFTQIEKQS
jgi:transcriptional antiterminator NusG